MDFRKLTNEDLAFVRQNPYEKAVKGYHFMDAPEENAYTVIFENAIVAAAGVQVNREGVGLAWLMLTDECKKHGIYGLLALYTIREKLDKIIEENKLWRVTAEVRADFPEAIKMIESFGFKRECLMEMHCPDKGDAYLYSRIRRDI